MSSPVVDRPLVNPVGERQIRKYLLPGEQTVIVTRRHWVVLVPSGAAVTGSFLLASTAAVRVGDSAPLVVNAATLIMLLCIGWLLWEVWAYSRDWFAVTSERLLLTYVILTRRVAAMPLTKVTDMSYNVTIPGRVLRYGEFVFESAGQDQALRSISPLPGSQRLFRTLSAELFGEGGIASTRRVRVPPRRSSDD